MSVSRYMSDSEIHSREGKQYYEGLLRARPKDKLLLTEYFDFLRRISRQSFGIMYAMLPNLSYPLFFRANTSDVYNLKQMFVNEEYGFSFPFAPRRILDLGGYCGYAAVFFASRFPDAQILCVEPSVQNFAMLTVNTLPYDNIRRINGAVWNRSTHLKLEQRLGGHWGSIFGEGVGTKDNETRAYTVKELLDYAGWDAADYIKCDIEGAEVEVFGDESAETWIGRTAVLSVETHDRFRAESTATVNAAMPLDKFSWQESGEFNIFVNKSLVARTDAVVPIRLLSGNSGVRRFRTGNVNPANWGIMLVDEDTLQLHPNAPGEAPATAIFHVDLEGHRQFYSKIVVEGGGIDKVVFSIRIDHGGNRILEQSFVSVPGSLQELKLEFEPIFGRVALSISTQMASDAKTQGRAWARWVKPTFSIDIE